MVINKSIDSSVVYLWRNQRNLSRPNYRTRKSWCVCVCVCVCVLAHCDVGMFKCGNDRCVTMSSVCNGADNCGDFTDELSCTSRKFLLLVCSHSAKDTIASSVNLLFCVNLISPPGITMPRRAYVLPMLLCEVLWWVCLFVCLCVCLAARISP